MKPHPLKELADLAEEFHFKILNKLISNSIFLLQKTYDNLNDGDKKLFIEQIQKETK